MHVRAEVEKWLVGRYVDVILDSEADIIEGEYHRVDAARRAEVEIEALQAMEEEKPRDR